MQAVSNNNFLEEKTFLNYSSCYVLALQTDNNNYVLSQSIPGHRGGTQDINELLNFIESPSNCQDVKSSVSGKNNRNSNGPVTLKER